MQTPLPSSRGLMMLHPAQVLEGQACFLPEMLAISLVAISLSSAQPYLSKFTSVISYNLQWWCSSNSMQDFVNHEQQAVDKLTAKLSQKECCKDA